MVSEPHRRPASWRPPERDELNALQVPSTGDDIESALAAAERLLTQAREDARHAQNVQFAAMSLLILSLVSLAGVVIAIIESASSASVLAIASLFAIGAPASLYLLQMARAASNQRDSLNLEIATEIALMVGDIFLDVAQREKWSVMRRESVRLRLSAFPLGSHAMRTAEYSIARGRKDVTHGRR